MRTMAKSAASTGPSDCAPRRFTRPCSIARAGAVIPSALMRPPKTKRTTRAATSRRRGNQPMPDRRRGSTSSSPGTRVATAMLSCGQACTQSMQNVQSRLPTFDGRNNANSQPRRSTRDGTASSRRPLMQSTVRHVLHVSGCRTCSSSGDIVDATKLNWPMGQRYLQKVAPVNCRSIASAAAK